MNAENKVTKWLDSIIEDLQADLSTLKNSPLSQEVSSAKVDSLDELKNLSISLQTLTEREREINDVERSIQSIREMIETYNELVESCDILEELDKRNVYQEAHNTDYLLKLSRTLNLVKEGIGTIRDSDIYHFESLEHALQTIKFQFNLIFKKVRSKSFDTELITHLSSHSFVKVEDAVTHLKTQGLVPVYGYLSNGGLVFNMLCEDDGMDVNVCISDYNTILVHMYSPKQYLDYRITASRTIRDTPPVQIKGTFESALTLSYQTLRFMASNEITNDMITDIRSILKSNSFITSIDFPRIQEQLEA